MLHLLNFPSNNRPISSHDRYVVNFDFGFNNTSVSNHFLVDFDRLNIAIRFLQVFIYIDECHCTSIKYSHDISRLVGKPTQIDLYSRRKELEA